MNKTELIEELATRTDISKAKSSDYLNNLIEIFTEKLKAGDSIVVPGFMTATVAQRSARTGRNPQTGDVINIPAVRVPKFKAGKQLKDAVK